ncbi:MAG TPA: N-acetylmuramoyl-L-alanine amidase [Bryobacteraceae bacterium]|nr:N-acetylmuramoyl-L-alanine amidase [Bryobacteraceae bacterium]
MAGCISGRRNRIATAALVCALLGASASLTVSRAATRPASSKVTAVRFWSLGDLTRVAIEVSGDFKFRSERLPNPERLVFDIQGARPVMVTKGMHVIPVNDALMKQIRVAETQPGVTRVVLDLEHLGEFTASQLANPNRLMIEVRSKAGGGAPVGTSTTGAQKIKETPVRPVAPDLVARTTLPSFDSLAPTKRPAEEMKPAETHAPRRFVPPPVRQDPAPLLAKPVLSPPATLSLQTKPKPPAVSTSIRKDLPPPPAPVLIAKNLVPDPGPSLPPFSSLAESTPTRLPAPNSARIADPKPLEIEAVPAKRNSNGDRSLTRVLGLKLSRVVLDAGHGGHDVGTHGPSGLFEKDLVLDVTKRLGELLEARLVREVIYTRTTDVFIPLEDRPRIANTQKADLFLSIHANSSPVKSVTGVETYYLNFTTSKAALEVAARENASSERSIFDLKELLQKIALKDKIDESREFAGRLQTSLYGLSSKNAAAAAGAGAKNRGTKKAPFVVLIGAQMPAVLAEIGFLSNPAEEALLKKPEQRQKIAEALYKGIVAYVDTLSHPQQVAKRDE